MTAILSKGEVELIKVADVPSRGYNYSKIYRYTIPFFFRFAY